MATLTDLRQHLEPTQYCECANCGNLYTVAELNPIRDFGLRCMPGEETPAGECPAEDCGAFCFLEGDREDS